MTSYRIEWWVEDKNNYLVQILSVDDKKKLYCKFEIDHRFNEHNKFFTYLSYDIKSYNIIISDNNDNIVDDFILYSETEDGMYTDRWSVVITKNKVLLCS